MVNPIRVLLVEDTPFAQTVVKAQMTKQGCLVDIVENGARALEKSQVKKYDLILMDISLGDGPDGFIATQNIKKYSTLNKDTPIVAVTLHGGTDFKQKAIDVGMEEYFHKPFTPEDAKKIIDYVKIKMSTNQ